MGLCFWRKAGGASTRIRRRIPVPVSEAGAGHSFAQAALFQEILLQSAELLIYEVIGLVDQADGNIGDHFGRAGFHERAVKLVGLRDFAPEPADIEGFLGVFVPFGVFAHAEVIAVIVEQFFEAGTAHVGELDLGFLGSGGRLAAFQDVLFAGPGGLHHLVVGAGFLAYEAVAEMERGIIHHQRLLVGEQLLVAAVGWDEGVGSGLAIFQGRKGLQGRRGTRSSFCPLCRFGHSLRRHGLWFLSSAEAPSPAWLIPRIGSPVWQ